MNTVMRYHASPKAWAAMFLLVIAILCGEVGSIVWTYEQSRTQHQICQAFGFFGDRTQQQIDSAGRHLKADTKKGDAVASSLDRKSIADGTDFLIRIRKVKC